MGSYTLYCRKTENNLNKKMFKILFKLGVRVIASF